MSSVAAALGGMGLTQPAAAEPDSYGGFGPGGPSTSTNDSTNTNTITNDSTRDSFGGAADHSIRNSIRTAAPTSPAVNDILDTVYDPVSEYTGQEVSWEVSSPETTSPETTSPETTSPETTSPETTEVPVEYEPAKTGDSGNVTAPRSNTNVVDRFGNPITTSGGTSSPAETPSAEPKESDTSGDVVSMCDISCGDAPEEANEAEREQEVFNQDVGFGAQFSKKGTRGPGTYVDYLPDFGTFEVVITPNGNVESGTFTGLTDNNSTTFTIDVDGQPTNQVPLPRVDDYDPENGGGTQVDWNENYFTAEPNNSLASGNESGANNEQNNTSGKSLTTRAGNDVGTRDGGSVSIGSTSSGDSALIQDGGDTGQQTPLPVAQPAECVDTDGDGWGWTGSESCPIAPADVTHPECVDHDGDGWGWNGTESCIM